MVNLAQDPNVRVLRVEHAEQFKSTWSPSDANTIYRVDDVFGETTLDEGRLREWSAALDKIEAARRRKARIVFCTRDYIFAAAERKLKRNRVNVLDDARVRVNVTTLTEAERDAILYNHIKDGDITRVQKTALKKHLSQLARLSSFSPELARRLGSARFHEGIDCDLKGLRAFFEHPVEHFRDVIQGLSGSETAALAVCLLSGNAVADPVPDDAITDAVLKTYGVSIQQVREAMELLEGSLVKRVRQSTQQWWQLHHPSMIEALQNEMVTRSSQLVLYLQSANLRAVLRDTTTVAPEPDSRLVFVPESVYEHLAVRLCAKRTSDIEDVAVYLAERGSDSFLRFVVSAYPDVIEQVLSVVPEPESRDGAVRLAVRMGRTQPPMLTAERHRNVEAAMRQSAKEAGWCGFLDVEGVRNTFPELVQEFLATEVAEGFGSVDLMYSWYAQDLSSVDFVQGAIQAIESHCDRLSQALSPDGDPRKELQESIDWRRQEALKLLEACLLRFEEGEEQWANDHEDDWKEQWHEERYELENGRFADVDE